MAEIIFKYVTLLLIGVLLGFLIGISISRCSIKAREHEIYLIGFRYAELDRKCKFYEDRSNKLTEAITDLEKDMISKEKSIERLEKRTEKLKVENKTLFEKTMYSEAKNMGDEDYIKYLEALLDKSNITYINRESSQPFSLLGDESNE